MYSVYACWFHRRIRISGGRVCLLSAVAGGAHVGTAAAYCFGCFAWLGHFNGLAFIRHTVSCYAGRRDNATTATALLAWAAHERFHALYLFSGPGAVVR
ncbi:hypothetical protein AVEN_269383-1 [Araneus ventricosus]|uniref:Uncharacterized protein n=1 Tax=Araneus ventricosus TaxID=182803 RepID=A0A4Y2VM29_ARAVE|nr:hypothetical protein AVEN_269383-1 [Araneus ventricosus]